MMEQADTSIQIVFIDDEVVQNAIANESARTRCESFNTSFHSATEAPGLQPVSEAPYSVRRWLPLICKTRNLYESQIQQVVLSPSQLRLLIRTAQGSIPVQRLNRMYEDDIEVEIAPTLTKHLSFPPEGLFLRLDACSPKDGNGGISALRNIEQVILRLVTSTRALNAMTDVAKDEAANLALYFMPFNPELRGEREYRVFCPPSSVGISAISQYRWHKPWVCSKMPEEDKKRTIALVTSSARTIQELIDADLDQSDANDALMIEQGYTFDMAVTEEEEDLGLIELNAFGARGPTGSCLFNWVSDREQLYHKVSGKIEFRTSFNRRA